MILYHRTSREAAEAIVASGTWVSKEHDQSIYFSTTPTGAIDGYGEVVLRVDVDPDVAVLDDEFPDGELHYRVHADALSGLDVSQA
ncbi:hypothetical protein [Gordonia malaquae]|uniref:hypothetical protein n=1 Tax=Gordonia malaquae TaxID=410332 RepID=UPI003016D5A4